MEIKGSHDPPVIQDTMINSNNGKELKSTLAPKLLYSNGHKVSENPFVFLQLLKVLAGSTLLQFCQ